MSLSCVINFTLIGSRFARENYNRRLTGPECVSGSDNEEIQCCEPFQSSLLDYITETDKLKFTSQSHQYLPKDILNDIKHYLFN